MVLRGFASLWGNVGGGGSNLLFYTPKYPCRVSNRPELGGIVPILLENPDSTSVGIRVSQFWRTALTSQRAEKCVFVKLS